MTKHDHSDDLGALLRNHDPAGNRELAEADARLMRSRITNESGDRRSPGRRRLIWAVVVVVAALAIAVNLNNDRDAGEVSKNPMTSRATRQQSDEPTVRQIRYETAGGTRVIWTLNSEFEL